MLLPPDLGELIPEEHLVRVVNRMIEQIDLEPLLRQYKGGGTSSYHPEMMLKVLVYAYTQKTYSSRLIAKALRENVNFMWISGGNRPDFRTINGFRGKRMKGVIEEVFTSVLMHLIEEGYVKLENYFVDGTKIRANANKHSWVWAKNTRRYKQGLQKKIKELLEEIEQEHEKENEAYGDEDLEEMGGSGGGEIDSGALKKRMEELNQCLKEQVDDKKLAKGMRTLEKEYLPRQEKYEEQEKKLNGRNSYSKTDEDATFMRMKEDGQGKEVRPKPGYNVQIGTENQFVVGFSIHQRPGDSGCLIPHLESLKENLGRLPKRVVSDAGYGSEENYAYLEKEELDNYVKYNTFHPEQKQKWKRQIYRVENLDYDEEQDEFICPQGKRLKYAETREQLTANGYPTERRIYECEDCSQCPVKQVCTRAAGNRRVRISFRLKQYRQQARENLLSEQGKTLRSQRPVDVETVFGHFKQNWGFRRFMLRGLENVKTEWGLLSIAHNLSKLATQ